MGGLLSIFDFLFKKESIEMEQVIACEEAIEDEEAENNEKAEEEALILKRGE